MNRYGHRGKVCGEEWSMTKNQKKLNRNMAVCIVLGIGALLLLLVVLTGIQKNASIGKVREIGRAHV